MVSLSLPKLIAIKGPSATESIIISKDWPYAWFIADIQTLYPF